MVKTTNLSKVHAEPVELFSQGHQDFSIVLSLTSSSDESQSSSEREWNITCGRSECVSGTEGTAGIRGSVCLPVLLDCAIGWADDFPPAVGRISRKEGWGYSIIGPVGKG